MDDNYPTLNIPHNRVDAPLTNLEGPCNLLSSVGEELMSESKVQNIMGINLNTSVTLIDLIVPFLRRKDLLSFQTTSKLCRSRSLPDFYADIEFYYRVSGDRSYRLLLLLETLLKHPGRAELVRHLTLRDAEYPLKGPQLDVRPAANDSRISRLANQDRELLQKAIPQRDDLPLPDQWLAMLRDDPPSVIIPMILWHTSNLKSLYLDFTLHARSWLMREIITCSAKQWSRPHTESNLPLSKLKKVTFAEASPGMSRTLVTPGLMIIQALLFLPSLEQISAVVGPPNLLGLPVSFTDDVSQLHVQNLRSLELRRSNIDLPTLHKLLSALPKLVSFRYEWWRNLDSDPKEGSIFNSQLFMDAMSSFKNTLRTFSLDIHFYCTTFDFGINPGWYGTQGCLTGLEEWTSITQLRAPLSVLLHESLEGYDFTRFPPSLEGILITEDGFDLYEFESQHVLEALRRFLGNWRSTCPKLGILAFEVSDPDNDIWEDHARIDAMTQCNSAKLECRFVSIV